MTKDSPPVRVHSIKLTSSSGLAFTVPDSPVDFDQGRFTTLIGQNGSGKTTLLEAILGIRTDYSVRRSILGSDRIDLPNSIKRRIGVSTQVHSYSDGVTVRDVVRLHGGVYGVPINAELLDLLDLTKVVGSAYTKTSGGQKKRLSLYFSLAHEPEVAFLDEPEAGLDVQGLEALLDRVQERSKAGHTTIAATHNGMMTDRAENVVFLHSGDIVYAGQKSCFVKQYLGNSVLEVDTDGLSKQDIERISLVGKAQCFDGVGTDKLLLFGNDASLAELRGMPDLGIGQRSILRKIKPADVMAWINARTATKCLP